MYERVHKINKRLNNLLLLLRSGSYSAGDLSKKLHVSIPTVYRDIESLRLSGFEIEAVRNKKGWHYKLVSTGNQLELGV